MYDAMTALADTLTAALGDHATVTLDAAAAGSILPTRPAVIIDPPAVTWETSTALNVTWTLYVVAGPTHDLPRATNTIWDIIARITTILDITEARPAAFQPNNGPTYPAYTLTTADDPYTQ